MPNYLGLEHGGSQKSIPKIQLYESEILQKVASKEKPIVIEKCDVPMFKKFIERIGGTDDLKIRYFKTHDCAKDDNEAVVNFLFTRYPKVFITSQAANSSEVGINRLALPRRDLTVGAVG
jgi:hypothetical protein